MMFAAILLAQAAASPPPVQATASPPPGQATASLSPPPGLQFGFYRMAAFRQRVQESNCGGELVALDTLRKRLASRFGKKAFAWPKVPASAPGDCRFVSSVFQANFTDFRKDAEAALAMPVADTGGK